MTLLSLNLFAVQIGENAPTFNLEGFPKKIDLAKLKGKYVVLEWYNDGCPFVRKHYDANNMQALQNKYKDKVTWLAVNSSAPGKQGHLSDSAAAKAMYKKEKMSATSLILDKGGNTGQKYEAKTTPHMYIINPKGKLIYQGAIDSISSADPADIKKSDNYVAMALDQALAGKPVKMAKTRPYGCSVKY